MPSISELMEQDGIQVGDISSLYPNILRELEIRPHHSKPIPALRGIERSIEKIVVNSEYGIMPTTTEVRISKSKTKVKPRMKTIKQMPEVEVNVEVEEESVVREGHVTNKCRCGCLLREHKYDSSTGNMPCRHRHNPKCLNYERSIDKQTTRAITV